MEEGARGQQQTGKARPSTRGQRGSGGEDDNDATVRLRVEDGPAGQRAMER
ncbi:hypothetical protein Syun_030891 [Stephania yunnanensis]|uniref:Uncharacterized protein n=1 Tax=Stephania yunnanensis TaxID=152371 RepID=A0AAP0HB22_9MAGN